MFNATFNNISVISWRCYICIYEIVTKSNSLIMFNTKNIHIFLLPVKFLLTLFNDSTTNRLLLLIFVPERFGTHDLNFNKDGKLHKKFIVRTILSYSSTF